MGVAVPRAEPAAAAELFQKVVDGGDGAEGAVAVDVDVFADAFDPTLADAVAAERRSQVGTGERSEKIRTYFFLRGQVVDQRLTGDGRYFRLESVLNGGLDEIIDRLTEAEQTEKLKAQSE